MDTKYYIPDISEFHVGFEYEHCHSSIRFVMLDLKTGETSNETEPKEIWEKSVFTGNEFDAWKSSFKFDDSLRDGQIRVKCLDKEDIESLGFKDHNGEPRIYEENNVIGFVVWNGKDEYIIKYDTESRIIKSIVHTAGLHKMFNCFFGIKVNNKSELEKLLKQLEITNERQVY